MSKKGLINEGDASYDAVNLLLTGTKSEQDANRCWINIANHFVDEEKKWTNVDELRTHENNPFMVRKKFMQLVPMQQRFIGSFAFSFFVLSRTRGSPVKHLISLWVFCPEFVSAFIPS